MGKFQDLIVWQRAEKLAISVYTLTKEKSISTDFGLKDQLQRAAVSIPANIAEGDELGTNKQSIRHFYIAKGSTAELITELVISKEIGYFSNDQIEPLTTECKIISTMLSRLIKARS